MGTATVVILSAAKDLLSVGVNGVTQEQILQSLRSLGMTAIVPAVA